ncbi:MAG: SIS domain-containing protein [Lachnospiraceae bacterium]
MEDENEAGQEKTEILPDNHEEICAFFDELKSGKYEAKLEKAASMIAKTERLFLAGVGNSGNIGQYGARCFTNMGKFSLYISDPFYPVSFFQAGSALAVVLSVSGETPEAVDIANRLKKAGCAIISITNKEACTIAKLSDLNISYHISMCREGLHVDFSTQVPAVYLLEMLGKKVRNRLSEE